MNVSSTLSDRDTAEIRRMYRSFSEAIVTRNVDALLKYYTDDAVAMPPNYPAASGHTAIRAWLEAMPSVNNIDFVVEEIAGSGDLAMVRGTYSMSLAIPGVPQSVNDQGKFIEIRKRQPDGSWPMWRDIFNSNIALGSADHATAERRKPLTLSKQDQEQIETLFRSYGEAWGKRDAKACAALYTSDGDVVAIDGSVLRSPSALERYYEEQLSGPYKDYTVSDFQFEAIRTLSPDIALQNGSWLVHGIKGKDAGVLVRATFISRREPAGWRYVAVRLMVPFRTNA